jgi:hypothetical protein
MRILLVALLLLAPAITQANGVERGDKMDIFPSFPHSPAFEQFLASRLNDYCDLSDSGSPTNTVLIPLVIQRMNGGVEVVTEVELYSALTGQKVDSMKITSREGPSPDSIKIKSAETHERCTRRLID